MIRYKNQSYQNKMESFFGVPQAYVGGIECQVKGNLHVHVIVFLAEFPRDSDRWLK